MAELLSAAVNAHDLLVNICEFLDNGTPIRNGSDLHADACAFRDQLSEAIGGAESRMAVSHTPGPWHVTPNGFGVFSAPIKPDAYGKVCSQEVAIVRPAMSPEGKANAMLIAAAPDLLDALERLHAECESHFEGMSADSKAFSALSVADFAIAKAKGGA